MMRAGLALIALCVWGPPPTDDGRRTSCAFGETRVLAQQTPPRDTRPPLVVGAAVIAGSVVSDEAVPKPVRRARVTLTPPDGLSPTVITNEEGGFVFQRLPAGRYTVGVSKDAWVSMNYGATRTGRPGTPIVLAEGETRRVTVRLAKGAVITGTVLDAEGRPAISVLVDALRYNYTPATGDRRLTPAGVTAYSDDRGSYRIFGLPAGDYYVAAPMRSAQALLRTLSEADVRDAMAALRSSRGVARPSAAGPPPVVTSEASRTVVLSPSFYPGAADPAHAKMVTVAAAEERAGIDLHLQYVPTATVAGTVSGATAGQSLIVSLVRRSADVRGALDVKTANVRESGQFSLSSIAPGEYILMARSAVRSSAAAAEPLPQLWASMDLAVTGEDITNLTLSLQPGSIVSGRIVFDGVSSPPLTRFQFPLPLAPANTYFSVGGRMPSAQIEADGRFTIPGITPVPYRIALIEGVRAPMYGWWLKSVVANGRDLLDGAIDLRQNLSDVVVTFTDRVSELTGTITDSRGAAVAGGFAVVFSTDETTWFHNSRRVAGVPPAPDGRYIIRNLPPGEYHAIAVDDVDVGEWFDPVLLKRLIPRAMRFTIGEQEQKTMDLVAGR